MKNTWILIAHRGGARIFENRGPGKGLNLVQEIRHPEGRLKSKEIGSDEPGRSFDSHGLRHSLQTEVAPAAHVTGIFARELAGILDEGRVRQRYARLVLVAEARFLGILRAALSRETSALVTTALVKDLANVEAGEMPERLRDVIQL